MPSRDASSLKLLHRVSTQSHSCWIRLQTSPCLPAVCMHCLPQQGNRLWQKLRRTAVQDGSRILDNGTTVLALLMQQCVAIWVRPGQCCICPMVRLCREETPIFGCPVLSPSSSMQACIRLVHQCLQNCRQIACTLAAHLSSASLPRDVSSLPDYRRMVGITVSEAAHFVPCTQAGC